LWTIICPVSGSDSSPAYCQAIFLSRLCLLKVCKELSSLLLPASLMHSVYPAVCSFQFLVYHPVFFSMGWGSVCPGGYAVYPSSGCGNTECPLFVYLLVCISQAGLELASGGMGALLFLSVTWYGEALYRLEVQGVTVLIIFGALFLPSVALVSQQDFDFWSSLCLLLHPSCHLGCSS
jgi:hypothetical protein